MPSSNASWIDSSCDRLDALPLARKAETGEIGAERLLTILVRQDSHKLAKIVLEAGFGVALLHHGRQCHLYTGRLWSFYDTVVLVKIRGGLEGVRRVQLGPPALYQATSGRQVLEEDGERLVDGKVAALVATDRIASRSADYLCHFFLGQAELEPDTLQLLPGQPAESTGRVVMASIGADRVGLMPSQRTAATSRIES
jgi:hypothetical protein